MPASNTSGSDSDYTDSDADLSSGDEDCNLSSPKPTRPPRVPGLNLGSFSIGSIPAQQVAARQQVPGLSLGGLSLGTQAPTPAQPAHLGDAVELPIDSWQNGARSVEQRATSPLGDSAARQESVSPAGSSEIPSSTGSGPKIQLSLQLPRSPVDRAHGAARGGDDVSLYAGKDGVMAVDLVSMGFHLELPAQGAPSAQGGGERMIDLVRQRCVRSLGVAPADLCFYEIRKLEDDGELPADCRNIGVAIRQSSFSLAAMEDLVAENKKLSASAEKSNSTLLSLENMMKEQTQTFSREKLRSLELDVETKRMRDKMRGLEDHVEALKSELARSEALRLTGQRSLAKLQREFEVLSREFSVRHPDNNQNPTGHRRASNGPPSPRLHNIAHTGSLQAILTPGSRVGDMLERLCSDEVLSRLEKCLGKMGNDPPS